MDTPKLWTKNFIIIAITTFLVFAGFYYLLVTLPVYALQDLGAKSAEAGLISTVFLISAIITRPLAGRWMERVGKPTVLVTSLVILLAASLLYVLLDSVTTLFALRFFHGIGFGMATTATGAIVADIIPDSRRGEGMGYYGLTMNLAMVIGPFLGLFVYQNASVSVYFSIGAICAFTALIAGCFLRIPKLIESESHVHVPFRISGLFEKSAIPISAAAAIFALVYSSIISFVSVYAKEAGVVEASSYFFVVYAIVLLVSRPFTGKWFDRFGANVIVIPAIVLFGLGTLLLSQATTAFTFLLAAGLIGLGWGTAFPSLQTIAIQVAEPKKRAVATATFLSVFDLGFGVGSFLFGAAVSVVSIGSLYFYSTFVIFVGLIAYYLLYGKGTRRDRSEVFQLEEQKTRLGG